MAKAGGSGIRALIGADVPSSAARTPAAVTSPRARAVAQGQESNGRHAATPSTILYPRRMPPQASVGATGGGMLIKAADDKQPQLDALEALRARPDVDAETRLQIDREIKNIRAGARGEREAAYEIDFHYAKESNRVVIHDLRLEVDGRVAQIDHLIIDRVLTIWVCESKHFAEGVGVSDHGEWVAFYGGRPRGIPSPIEQNRRHIAVLEDVFDQKLVEPKKRLGVTIKPQLKSVILVSNNARISRPKGKAAAAAVDGLDTVMKVEKLQSVVMKGVEARVLSVLPRIVGTDTSSGSGETLWRFTGRPPSIGRQGSECPRWSQPPSLRRRMGWLSLRRICRYASRAPGLYQPPR